MGRVSESVITSTSGFYKGTAYAGQRNSTEGGVSLVTVSKICTAATAQRLFVDGGLPNYGVHCIALVLSLWSRNKSSAAAPSLTGVVCLINVSICQSERRGTLPYGTGVVVADGPKSLDTELPLCNARSTPGRILETKATKATKTNSQLAWIEVVQYGGHPHAC